MSAGKKQPARFTLTFGIGVPDDLATLREIEPAALDAAEDILDDLGHGRVRGKMLGTRNVSGDLTGLARVKFDVPGQRPQRFRLIYRQVDEVTRDVIAIGLRDEHAIYRTAARRIATQS